MTFKPAAIALAGSLSTKKLPKVAKRLPMRLLPAATVLALCLALQANAGTLLIQSCVIDKKGGV